MARITVEDCIDKFESRFELVLVASNRARKLHSGENPTVEKDNDKNTVIALREIADETISIDDMKNNLVEEYQTLSSNNEDEEEPSLENIDDIYGSDEPAFKKQEVVLDSITEMENSEEVSENKESLSDTIIDDIDIEDVSENQEAALDSIIGDSIMDEDVENQDTTSDTKIAEANKTMLTDNVDNLEDSNKEYFKEDSD